MLENLFKGLFDTDLTAVISVTDFLLCLGASLVIGILKRMFYISFLLTVLQSSKVEYRHYI